MELSERKIAAQFQLLVGAAETVLAGMFGRKAPADRELAAFYRTNRQCGSRDRAFINRTVYTLLRHWGWARKLAGERLVSELETGKALPSERDVSALLFFALACGGNDRESLSSAARIIGVQVPGGLTALPRETRAAAAAGALDIPMTFREEELLPEWARPLLPADFARRMPERPPMWLRINRNGQDHVLEELAAAGVAVETFPEFPEAAAVSAPSVNLAVLPCFQKGEVEVQDLASQCIVRFCAPRRKERWFDPCAGAGGKTLAIAEAMGRTGTVVAGDVRERILLELRRRARRSGYPDIVTRCHDGRPWRGLKPFDGVLIDAPCSCSGVWRRAPWGPWTMEEADIAKYAEKQTGILHSFSPCVKPGGVLVYATCSAFRQENEEVVERFLGAHPDFVLSRAPDPFTGAPGDGFMHMPEGFDCDIMFAAKMERKK
ncbi:MAG: RsmB/NOP family class I SAM-dependent RNA methyltransferase [Lentisphaeria bacterium]|nr:RsmB/NOP family class I SAM-dependent RNA methyltransferase [Lentisphaeria bacterium]